MFEDDFRHPRVVSVAFAAGRAPSIVGIDLDLTFLDLTDHIRRLAPTFREFEKEATSGCTTAILEHTAPAGAPEQAFSWTVVIPPAAAQSSSFKTGMFLHFQHEQRNHMLPPDFKRSEGGERRSDGTVVNVPYINSDDVNYSRLTTYLAPPLPKDASFPQAPPEPTFVFRVGTPPVIRDLFDNFPNFGWLRQLAASNKAVVMAMPFPKVTNFGPTATASGVDKLLSSLIVALDGEGLVGTSSTIPLTLSRVALGGWSSGTEALVRWCSGTQNMNLAIARLVDEVYFFDGKNSTRPALVAGGVVENWFRAAPGRRLRLIGTANTEAESVALATRLGNAEALDVVLERGGTPNALPVRALPGRSDYFYTNGLYKRALTAPAPALKPELRPVGSSPVLPEENVTDESNIFLAKASFAGGTTKAFIELAFDDPVAKVSRREKVVLHSTTEAAALLHNVVLPLRPRKVRAEARLRTPRTSITSSRTWSQTLTTQARRTACSSSGTPGPRWAAHCAVDASSATSNSVWSRAVSE